MRACEVNAKRISRGISLGSPFGMLGIAAVVRALGFCPLFGVPAEPDWPDCRPTTAPVWWCEVPRHQTWGTVGRLATGPVIHGSSIYPNAPGFQSTSINDYDSRRFGYFPEISVSIQPNPLVERMSAQTDRGDVIENIGIANLSATKTRDTITYKTAELPLAFSLPVHEYNSKYPPPLFLQDLNGNN